MSLPAIRAEIFARFISAPAGSSLKFALMEAVKALDRAIEAEARQAQTGDAA